MAPHMDVTERATTDQQTTNGDSAPEPARAVEQVAAMAARISDAVASVLAGRSEATSTSLACLLSGGPLLSEDLPGVGKTLLAQTLARAVGGSFHPRSAARRRDRHDGAAR